MAFDKNYYEGKKRTINMKYVKTMEELIDEMAMTLNKFFAYKGELNEQLREIAKREIEAGEGGEAAKAAGEGLEEKLAEVEDEAPADETPADEAAPEEAPKEGDSDGSEEA